MGATCIVCLSREASILRIITAHPFSVQPSRQLKMSRQSTTEEFRLPMTQRLFNRPHPDLPTGSLAPPSPATSRRTEETHRQWDRPKHHHPRRSSSSSSSSPRPPPFTSRTIHARPATTLKTVAPTTQGTPSKDAKRCLACAKVIWCTRVMSRGGRSSACLRWVSLPFCVLQGEMRELMSVLGCRKVQRYREQGSGGGSCAVERKSRVVMLQFNIRANSPLPADDEPSIMPQ